MHAMLIVLCTFEALRNWLVGALQMCRIALQSEVHQVSQAQDGPKALKTLRATGAVYILYIFEHTRAATSFTHVRPFSTHLGLPLYHHGHNNK